MGLLSFRYIYKKKTHFEYISNNNIPQLKTTLTLIYKISLWNVFRLPHMAANKLQTFRTTVQHNKMFGRHPEMGIQIWAVPSQQSTSFGNTVQFRGNECHSSVKLNTTKWQHNSKHFPECALFVFVCFSTVKASKCVPGKLSFFLFFFIRK